MGCPLVFIDSRNDEFPNAIVNSMQSFALTHNKIS